MSSIAAVMLAHGLDSGDCPDAEKPEHRPLVKDLDLDPEALKEQLRTHRQRRCKKCGFWAIWIPRRSAR